MKFAWLGWNNTTTHWLHKAIALGHECVAVFVPESQAHEVAESQALLPQRQDWEQLLLNEEVDGVLIPPPSSDTATHAHREDQLRKLVQAGVPLFFIPPACEAILAFELEMIRRDVQGVLYTFYAEKMHPFWKNSPLADHFEQIVIERHLPEQSRAQVQAAFLADVAQIQTFVTPLRRVAASGGSNLDKSRPGLENMNATLSGNNQCIVRWHVLPTQEAPHSKFTFFSPQHSFTILQNANWEWQFENKQLEAWTDSQALAAALTEFQQAIRHEKNSGMQWMESARLLESLEAVDRSLVRGRTIELYNEELSEASAFKGTMAVGGCLMLLIGLGVFLFAGIVISLYSALAKPESNASSGMRLFWQLLFLAPFVVFLLLQLLALGLPAYEKKKREQQSPSGKEKVG